MGLFDGGLGDLNLASGLGDFWSSLTNTGASPGFSLGNLTGGGGSGDSFSLSSLFGGGSDPKTDPSKDPWSLSNIFTPENIVKGGLTGLGIFNGLNTQDLAQQNLDTQNKHWDQEFGLKEQALAQAKEIAQMEAGVKKKIAKQQLIGKAYSDMIQAARDGRVDEARSLGRLVGHLQNVLLTPSNTRIRGTL